MAAKGRRTNQAKRAHEQPSGGLAARLTRPGGVLRWGLLVFGVWLILAFLYPEPMFRHQVFGSADAGNADAFAAVGDAALGDGHYPLWNPYLFAGMPSFGSLSYVKFLYPPSVVFNFLQQDLGFGPLTWMLGHLLFGGVGMVWLLSRWRLPAAALLLGAAAFLLFPKVVAWGVHGHGTQLGAIMYLPWLLGWSLRVLGGGGWRATGMVGLLLGLQLLRGHPQISFYSLVVVGWLGLWNALAPLDDVLGEAAAGVRWRRLGGLAAGLALGFLIGAALLVPVHEYAGISIRGQVAADGGGGLDYATGWSLAPSEIATLVQPAAAGFGLATYLGAMPFTDYPNYFGMLLLVLAAAGWRRRERNLVLSLGLLSVLALLVAFGDGFFLYEVLYDHLPYFDKFRVPSMVLIVPAFAVAILAARGAAHWSGGGEPGGRPWVLPGVLAALGVAMLLSGAASLGKSTFTSHLSGLAVAAGRQPVPVLLDEAWNLHRGSLIRIGLILMTAGAAVWTSARNRGFRAHGVVWVLAVLVGLDLAGVDRLITHPEKGLLQVGRTASGQARLQPAAPLLRDHSPRRESRTGPDARAIAAAVGHERIWPLGRFGGENTWMADGIRSLGGYHAAKLAQYETIRKRIYGEEPAGRLAGWLAGRVLVFERRFSDEEIAMFGGFGCDLDPEPVAAGRVALYRNRTALPRARLHDAWHPVEDLPAGADLGAFLDAMASGAIGSDGAVYLDQKPEPEPVASTVPPAPPVYIRDGLDEVELRTTSPVATVLVLADMNTPGWSVEVDDRPATLLTADLVLRGVALPAGDHTVRFVFRDPAVRAGLTLTAIGAILTVGMLLTPLILRRRADAGAEPDSLEPTRDA